MSFSKTTRIALKGLTYLAKQPEGAFVLVETVAESETLPRNYLSKIFQVLVRRRMLVSQRGRGGGYALAFPAARMSLESIAEAIEGSLPEEERECVLGFRKCDGSNPCAVHHAVRQSEDVLAAALSRVTLQDLAGNSQEVG